MIFCDCAVYHFCQYGAGRTGQCHGLCEHSSFYSTGYYAWGTGRNGVILVFETAYAHKNCVRNSTKVVIVLGVSFLLIAIEEWCKSIVSVSGLLAVVSMACVLKLKSTEFVSKRLSEKFGKLWIAAEVILFVLVGAAVDIRYTLSAGGAAVAMIFIALAFRSVGVLCCLVGTKLSGKERLFCVLAYLPKATVQAAIGSVPMAMGLSCGKSCFPWRCWLF